MATRGNLKQRDLIYMAGFFDGEGCVVISKVNLKNPNYKSPRYVLEVSAYNCDKPVMDWITTTFGGSSRLRVRPREKWYWKTSYGWKITSNKAVPFLEAILPHLKVKNRQAELGIRFQKEIMQSQRGQRNKLTTEELEDREKLHRLMVKINNRGLGARRD